MANLWEIDQDILGCLDAETGEIIDSERLDNLFMERNQKIENIALWVKNLESDILALKAEKDAFAEREAQARKKVEGLKKWLAEALEGQKFNTAKCAVSFRRSETVEVDDVALVPAELLRVKTAVEPDKTAIKKAIKEGREINGCRLVESINTQVR